MDYSSNGISIGKNIREVRERKNWSQKDLERRSGIVNTQISAYETEKKEPTLHTLATLASALEVTMDELYWGDVNEAFINVAPNESAQVVNCVYKLWELKVVDRYIASSGPSLSLKKHLAPLQRFLSTLNEFEYTKDTYDDKKQYISMLKDSIIKEIEQNEEKRHRPPIVAGSSEWK